MHAQQRAFIRFAMHHRVLRFGTFTLKSGRESPYFFNSGLFNRGESLLELGRFYATAVVDSGIRFDMLYGAAYKGIPLVVATATALASSHGIDVPWCFNRKEAKDHGEGGETVGAELAGRVLLIDDVISAGTSVTESVTLIRRAGAEAVGLVVALDREERGTGPQSAIVEVSERFRLRTASIVSLTDLVHFLEETGTMVDELERMRSYRAEFGA
jgi:orotate phosphoribosyltransferase